MTDLERQCVDLYLDGCLPESERSWLFQRLQTDPQAMAYLAARSQLHVDLRRCFTRRRLQHLAVDAAAAKPARGPRARRHTSWFSWRPLTAAAAGILLGLVGTSMVFGWGMHGGLERKSPLGVAEPSFENPETPLVRDFPPAPSLWGGDAARVVPAENGVTPRHGRFMLRLEPSIRGTPLLFPRLYQVIALPTTTTDVREIEVAASFASATPDSLPYYSIRAYAVTEAPGLLGPDWFDHREKAIASAAAGFENPPGRTGWQSLGLRIRVPGKARSLVVFFGIRTPDKSPPRLVHYLDAVEVSLVESSPIP